MNACYTGTLVSVIQSKLSWLEMSVCKLDCNEDIFVTLCIIMNICLFTHYFEQHPYNTQWYICSTPEGVLEVYEMFYLFWKCVMEYCIMVLLNSTMVTPWGSMIVSAI